MFETRRDNLNHSRLLIWISKSDPAHLQSLILSRLCRLVPRRVWAGLGPGRGRSPPQHQQSSRQAQRNADTSLTSARESGPLGAAETSTQHHFRFTRAHPQSNFTTTVLALYDSAA